MTSGECERSIFRQPQDKVSELNCFPTTRAAYCMEERPPGALDIYTSPVEWAIPSRGNECVNAP